MKTVKKILIILLVLLITGCSTKLNLNPGIGAEEYYRLDLSDLNKDAPLGNLRIITKDKYKFSVAKDKYKLDEDYKIDETGLDYLNISGSRQFSKEQFIELTNILDEVATNKKVYIIDLREENHALVNGYPISYFKVHNWANKDLKDDEIAKNQNIFFSNLINKKMTIYLKDDEEKASKDNIELTVKECITEEELVNNKGYEYINIPCTDHVWPKEDKIDRFIEFVKTIDMDNSWLHFHCVAGEGRTGTFMCLYDMMKNPNVAMKDITYRQTKLGSNYPLYLQDKDNWKKELYQEKTDKFVLLYQYVQENYKNNYQVLWSEWLKNR